MDLWSLVPPTLVSAAVSALVSFYVAKRTARRAEWSARVDDLVKDLRELSDLAVEYWTAELSDAELVAVGVRITTKFADVTEQLNALRERTDFHFDSERLEPLHDEVFDISTGADFQGFQRIVDAHRATDSARAIDELRNEVNRIRTRLLR